MALVTAALLLLVPPPAGLAQATSRSGDVTVTMGWRNEPPLTGFENAVEVIVEGAGGQPVRVRPAILDMEVTFGDEHTTLALAPADGEPGRLSAPLVPTRPGTYEFRLTGSVEGQRIDESAKCSDESFACVTSAADAEFPVSDPSPGELAQGVTRALPRSERAQSTATAAQIIGVVAAIVALVALVLAILGWRRSRGPQ